MSTAIIPLLILPLIIFGIALFIFSSQVTGVQTAKEKVFCGFPDWNTGINNITGSNAGCASTHHPTPYSDDVFVLWNTTVSGGFFSGGANWNFLATIPNGWVTYTGDIIWSALYRVGNAFFAFGLLVVFPIQISGLSWMLIPEAVLILWIIIGGVLTFKFG